MNMKTPIFKKRWTIIAVLILAFCMGTGSVYANKNEALPAASGRGIGLNTAPQGAGY